MEQVSKYRKRLRRLEKTEGCRRCKKPKGFTHSNKSPGLLGFQHKQFLPLRKAAIRLDNKQRADLFRSLSFAADAIGFEFDTKGIIADDDFKLTLQFVQLGQRLKKLNQDNDLLIVEDNGRFNVALRQHYCTGTTLYYISVLPLFKMLRQNRKCGELLLGVASYLFRFAAVPYFRDQSTYAYYQYEMLWEWLTVDPESWGDEPQHDKLNDLHAAFTIGDNMERLLSSRYPFDRLDTLLKIKPENPFEQRCYRLVEMTLRLRQQYPENYLFEHFRMPFDRDDYDGVIQPEEYISFVYDLDTWSGENLIESVSNQLNEYDCIAEPESITVFAESNATINTIDYQIKTMEIISGLCILLNNNPLND